MSETGIAIRQALVVVTSRSMSRNYLSGLLVVVVGIGALVWSAAPSIAMADGGAYTAMVDPPVVLTNASDKALLVKWQTSIPGLAAAPLEQFALSAGRRHEVVKHANFWIARKDSTGTQRNQPNTIEVWLYDQAQPDVLLAYYRTIRLLYPDTMAQDDKSVILEIDVTPKLGIEIRLETFR